MISRTLSCVLAALLALGLPAFGAPAFAGPLDDAAERYRPYVIDSIGQALTGARALSEHVAAHDVAGARAAWIAARAGWERSEVFTAGFVPELDAKIDAWPNATRGFHAIEAKLFGAGSADVQADVDTLVADLDALHRRLPELALTPQGLFDGIARLAYEVGESKADGGESRISGTSLLDMQNNVAGIEFAYRTVFAEALAASDGRSARAIEERIRELSVIVAAPDLRRVDVPALRRASERLVAALQGAAGPLGLRRPSLEAAAR
jgi:iron uptake system EfeUOB component EfeO/EfeM